MGAWHTSRVGRERKSNQGDSLNLNSGVHNAITLEAKTLLSTARLKAVMFTQFNRPDRRICIHIGAFSVYFVSLRHQCEQLRNVMPDKKSNLKFREDL